MYQLPMPVRLDAVKKVYLDIETTGLDVYGGDRSIGIALGFWKDNKWSCRYYPYGHEQGPNLNKEAVFRWLRTELIDKRIVGHNLGGFDLPFLKHEGLDLVKANRFRDTMHAPILLDPNAASYSLNAVCKGYLPSLEQKIEGLDKANLKAYHAEVVGEYAEQDVKLCGLVDPVLQKLIKKEKLEQILALESATIRPVVDMVSNGLLFDYAKAARWVDLVYRDLKEVEGLLEGVNYNSGKQLQKKCDEYGIVYPWNWACPSEKCEEAFAAYAQEKPYVCWRCNVEMVKKSAHFGKKFTKKMEHPFIKAAQKAKQLHKLLNTFLIPWTESLDKDTPILRYHLHQLRERDAKGGSSGAVSGRFSCSANGTGAQPQQVWATENQIEELGEDYLLRELFIPAHGKQLTAVDASQIEFRLFAHYSGDANLIAEYNENPKVDFHQLVAEKILKGMLPRKKAKNVNFGTLYNMGVPKFAREMNIPTLEAEEMFATYNAQFPAAKATRDRERRKASVGTPTVTLMGRRFSWTRETAKKAYVALNRLIQGSAADVMKQALVLAYEGGYFDTMRLTVHDEIVGDVTTQDQVIDLKAKLESKDLCDISVPLIWDAKVGRNWAFR